MGRIGRWGWRAGGCRRRWRADTAMGREAPVARRRKAAFYQVRFTPSVPPMLPSERWGAFVQRMGNVRVRAGEPSQERGKRSGEGSGALGRRLGTSRPVRLGAFMRASVNLRAKEWNVRTKVQERSREPHPPPPSPPAWARPSRDRCEASATPNFRVPLLSFRLSGRTPSYRLFRHHIDH